MPPRENTDEAGVPHQCSRADPCLLRVGFRRMGMMHIAHHMCTPHLQIQDTLSKLFGQVGMLDTPVPVGTAASCTCFQRICLCVQVGALFFVPWLVAPHAKPEHTPVALCKVASRAAIASALDGRHRLACETHPRTHARSHARTHVHTFARLHVQMFALQ